MTNSIRIVPYQSGLKDKITRLQKHLWSSNLELNKAYFEWKYEANPYVKSPMIYLATNDSDVVGMRGLVGTKWEAGNPQQNFFMLYADDLVIHPDYRNKGLFTKIMNEIHSALATKPYDFLCNLSAGQITLIGSLTSGWKRVGIMQPSLRRTFIQRTYSFIRRKLTNKMVIGCLSNWIHPIIFGRQPFRHLDKAYNKRRFLHNRLQLSKTGRSKAMAELIQRIKHDGRIRHVRDEQYLKWRYMNPLHEYRFVYAGEPRLDGYLVLKRNISDLADSSEVSIVDWEAINTDLLEKLLQSVLLGGKFNRVVAWEANLSNDFRKILGKYDFKLELQKGVLQQRPALILRSIRDNHDQSRQSIAGRHLLDFSDWDIRMIYSMYG